MYIYISIENFRGCLVEKILLDNKLEKQANTYLTSIEFFKNEFSKYGKDNRNEVDGENAFKRSEMSSSANGPLKRQVGRYIGIE